MIESYQCVSLFINSYTIAAHPLWSPNALAHILKGMTCYIRTTFQFDTLPKRNELWVNYFASLMVFWCLQLLWWLTRHILQLYIKWASAWDFKQCGILTCADSDEPVQPPVRRRNSKLCSVSSLTIIEYSSDKQRLWSDCAYAQADLRLCWSHIPHCWKSHAPAH